MTRNKSVCANLQGYTTRLDLLDSFDLVFIFVFDDDDRRVCASVSHYLSPARLLYEY